MRAVGFIDFFEFGDDGGFFGFAKAFPNGMEKLVSGSRFDEARKIGGT